MKLKIGILGTRGIPNHYGGFEQFTQQLSVGLLKKGHEVYVYNSSLHPYKEATWKGVNIIHCEDKENKWGTAGQFIYDLNCNKDAGKRNYDVLLHFGYSSDSIWYRRWPKKTLNMVNMDGLEWKRTKYNLFVRNFLKTAEGLAAKHADVLIADSLGIKEHLLKQYDKPSHFIPYCADVFLNPDMNQLERLKLHPNEYYLSIARIEPENNIEIIIKGYLAADKRHPLVIIGNTSTPLGKRISKKYSDPHIIFPGAIYDTDLLNNLRHYSLGYFHGHSVGGTNPSLLEAMACGCRIIAHENVFNRTILGHDADYFTDATEITAILNKDSNRNMLEERVRANISKIESVYNPARITDQYEELMLASLRERK